MANVNQTISARPQSAPPVQADKHASAALARAAALHLEDRREEALSVLNGAIDAGESEAELFSARALLQYELGQFAEAASGYEQVLSLHPQHPTAPYNLAVCYERLGRWQDAAAAFSKAVQREPNRLDARLGLGIALLHLEKAQPALEAFEKVLAEAPDQETAQFGKGVALQLMAKLDEAAAIYARLFEKNPHSEECATNIDRKSVV